MLKFAKAAVAAAAALFISAQAPLAAGVPESPDPIRVVLNDWTGQHFSAKVTGELLKKMGYNVEFVSAGTVPQIAGMAQGNLHIQPEFWTNNVGDIYPKALETGDVVNIGPLGIEAKEGWIYPPYMKDKCPGLPSYKALYDCAQAFATAETFPKGRLITYPADWGTRSRDLVAQIGLPFEPIPGGSEGAMVAELKSAYAAGEPILMMFWQPHWIFAEHDFEWIEWNAPEGGVCVEDQQTRENACGFVQAGVDKIMWGGVKDKWPAAYRFMEQLTITNDDENAAMLAVDKNGRDLDEVVAEWIAANEARWKPWIEAATK